MNVNLLADKPVLTSKTFCKMFDSIFCPCCKTVRRHFSLSMLSLSLTISPTQIVNFIRHHSAGHLKVVFRKHAFLERASCWGPSSNSFYKLDFAFCLSLSPSVLSFLLILLLLLLLWCSADVCCLLSANSPTSPSSSSTTFCFYVFFNNFLPK